MLHHPIPCNAIQKRPQRPPFRIELFRLSNQGHENILHNLLGSPDVSRHPQGKAIERRLVPAIQLHKGLFIALRRAAQQYVVPFLCLDVHLSWCDARLTLDTSRATAKKFPSPGPSPNSFTINSLEGVESRVDPLSAKRKLPCHPDRRPAPFAGRSGGIVARSFLATDSPVSDAKHQDCHSGRSDESAFRKIQKSGSYFACAFSGRNIFAAIRVTARRGTSRCDCAPDNCPCRRSRSSCPPPAPAIPCVPPSPPFPAYFAGELLLPRHGVKFRLRRTRAQRANANAVGLHLFGQPLGKQEDRTPSSPRTSKCTAPPETLPLTPESAHRLSAAPPCPQDTAASGAPPPRNSPAPCPAAAAFPPL